MRLLFIFFFCFLFKFQYAKELILVQDQSILPLANYSYTYEDKTDNATLNEIIDIKWKNPSEDALNFGIARHPQWIKLAIYNELDVKIQRYLFIPYHHIEYIDAYVVVKDSIRSHLKTGTARPYHNKAISSHGYPIDLTLNSYERANVYIRVDHRNLPLRAGLFLLAHEEMMESKYSFQGLIWFWKGVIASSVLLSLITFFFLKTRLFLYYGLLLIGVVLFVGLEIGDYFQVFEIDKRNTIIDLKHFGNLLVIFSFPMFLNELSPLKKLQPVLWKITIWLVFPFAILFLLVLFDPIKDTIILFIITNYAIYISALIFIMQLVFLFNAALKKKKNALLLFIIYSVYIAIFLLTNSLPNLGIIKDNSVNIYAIFVVSSILEILTFLILVARETFMVYEERTVLIQQQKNHQKNLLLATVDSQEKERNKVGKELHDMVGANMAVIKQKIDKSNLELRNIVHQTIEIIRNLSHGLITPQLKDEDFADEIRELCILSSNENFVVQCFLHNWENIVMNQDSTTHLYRIVQELLQNAIKHSEASNVYLQFSIESNNLSLMYDDNGIGFNNNLNESRGIGLLNIENRVKLLNGEIHFDNTGNNKGVSILMDFPVFIS